MQELNINLLQIQNWFTSTNQGNYTLVEIKPQYKLAFFAQFKNAIRQYYISDTMLADAIAKNAGSWPTAKIASERIISSLIPSEPTIMSGDFGEALSAFIQGVNHHPNDLMDPKKLRLKPGRNTPAPHSDVIQLSLPNWPNTSANDAILCAEVKTKSTKSSQNQIENAVGGSDQDRDGRLVETLLWLGEKSLTQDMGNIKYVHFGRFIDAVDHEDSYTRQYFAIAVVCSNLLQQELQTTNWSDLKTSHCAVIVISVPDLKDQYEATFRTVST